MIINIQQIHFLCGDSYDGALAFPDLNDVTAISSQRDTLLAARLLDTSGTGAGSGYSTAQARAMGAKIRLIASLRAGAGKKASCPDCGKAVNLS